MNAAVISLAAAITGLSSRILFYSDAAVTIAAPPSSAGPDSQKPSYHLATPIITNLAEPTEVWVRLELTYLIGGKIDENDKKLLVLQLTQDTIGYLRTLSLDNIEGSTGLVHLREDLLDRAIARSDGSVRDVFIRSLVVQ